MTSLWMVRCRRLPRSSQPTGERYGRASGRWLGVGKSVADESTFGGTETLKRSVWVETTAFWEENSTRSSIKSLCYIDPPSNAKLTPHPPLADLLSS